MYYWIQCFYAFLTQGVDLLTEVGRHCIFTTITMQEKPFAQPLALSLENASSLGELNVSQKFLDEILNGQIPT